CLLPHTPFFPYTTLFRSPAASTGQLIAPDFYRWIQTADGIYPPPWCRCAGNDVRSHGRPVAAVPRDRGAEQNTERCPRGYGWRRDRKSTRLNSSHVKISY